MSVPTALAVVALVLALADEARARGQSLTGWAVAVLCVAFLWGARL